MLQNKFFRDDELSNTDIFLPPPVPLYDKCKSLEATSRRSGSGMKSHTSVRILDQISSTYGFNY